MNKRARSKQNFVLCPLTNGFGTLWGEEGEVFKTLSFLSSAVFHTHSFSGCKLCLKHFSSPVLAPLLAMSYSAPRSLVPMLCHMSCVAQFSVLPGGNGSCCCSVSDCVWSLPEHPWAPRPGCTCVWLLSCSPHPGRAWLPHSQAFLCFAQSRHNKNPTQKQFFSSSSFPYCYSPDLVDFFPGAVHPQILRVFNSLQYLVLFTPAVETTVCPLHSQGHSWVSSYYCPTHCVWQMHKAGRQRLLMLTVVVHAVPASFPSSQHAA